MLILTIKYIMESILAAASIALSIFTLWITLWHRGKITATRPTIVVFAFEGMRKEEPKIFLRTLLRSSSKNGEVVESLFVRVKVNGLSQTFSTWAYGDNGIVRGSGLFVGEQGVEKYHHFIIPRSVKDFQFIPGTYEIEILAVIREKSIKLYLLTVELPKEMVAILNNGVLGVYFDWDPEQGKYNSYVESPNDEKMRRLLS